jgi:hypothetical protein
MLKKYLWLTTLSIAIVCGLSADAAFATCYGNDPCNACKNCKYCRHCAKEGGTCGVCKRRLMAAAQQGPLL